MYMRIYRPVTIAVVISMVLFMAAAMPLSAAEPATGRDGAGAPVPGWIMLEPGMSHWYKFTYDYDDSKTPPEALVVVKADMEGAISFEIETAANLARPKWDEDDNPRNPIGVGAPMLLKAHNHDGTEKEIQAELDAQNEHGFYVRNPMTLIWAGSTKATETFYVIVKNNHDHPCAYALNISGKTVAY
jgi:hypothetical protein